MLGIILFLVWFIPAVFVFVNLLEDDEVDVLTAVGASVVWPFWLIQAL